MSYSEHPELDYWGRAFTLLLVAAYAATVPLANWLVSNVGTACVPNGPCLIPVWFAPLLLSPSGVLMVGLALVLRDLVQERAGLAASLCAVAVGVLASYLVAPPALALALASAAAFAASELADTAVYTPLRRRGLVTAVLASSAVGLVVDSVLFLYLAFGSLDFLAGQVVGKLWAVLAATAVLLLLRRAPRPVHA